MPKVLLVEDDNNLREIFEMRLQAEGYETMSAGDGEEALVVAIKEKPDLVIADIMMPKLSGFEMVENMRATPELANVKVIMMTALGQAEDRTRGEKLGVVKYLVKSQVTLEDFVRVVREVLPPNPSGSDSGSTLVHPDKSAEPKTENINKEESEKTMQDDSTTPTNPPADSAVPPANNNPIGSPPPADAGISDDPQTTAQETNTVNGQINDFTNSPSAGSSDAGAPTSSTPADTGLPTAGDSTPAPVAPTEPPAEPTLPAPDSGNPPPPTNPV